jgi:hypothetical protein
METWSTPLIAATAAFLTLLLWRVRPRLGWGLNRGLGGKRLRETQARIEDAKTKGEQAMALCDAADLMGAGDARGMYLRAMRADPRSTAVIGRVVAGLSHRPRALQSLLWRYLAATPWTDSKDATLAALDALRALYEGPLRNAVRARALGHAREALAGSPSKPGPTPS